MGGPVGALLTFTAAYAVLVAAGLLLKEQPSDLTIVWPAAGLLMFVLWFTRLSLWPVIIGLQCVVEWSLSYVIPGGVATSWGLLLIAANAVGAVVAAMLLRRWLAAPQRFRVRRTLQFIGASAIGMLVGALVGAFGAMQWTPEHDYVRELQLWWAGSWLGALTIVPVAYSWVGPLRKLYERQTLKSAPELLLIAAILLAATVWVFLTPVDNIASILQMPVILAAVLTVAAFRLPQRWSRLLAAATIFVAAGITAYGVGPYTAGDPFEQLIELQTFLATLMLTAALLGTAVADLHMALQQLGDSEERYRNFVQHSNEAVWRIELDKPMPTAMPLEAQLDWLHSHAYVAECNVAFSRLERSDAKPPLAWKSDVPWHAIYRQHLEQAALQRYSMDGLQFTVDIEARTHTFLTAFPGFVEAGCLQRVWGVARDVTDLIDLQARLQREQDRLRVYARQLVNAEEKARRAAAVDLHDGIGQSLVTMSMTLEAARTQSQPPVRLLLDDVRALLRDVQERTRNMIADLSPPGLYELGLEPALQWLAVYVRMHDWLQVELDARLREDAIPIEMRVLVFKLVRELLRNVAKHAGVSAARVQVRGDRERISVEVRDEGKG
ncbi:MAG: MASE1 domain-containing protein, partial [Nevskiaceae bacterium]|nr:MASE1 domain-containing protein [Nevskiaceae bacterium]